jgi:hypothetical protein
VACNAQALDEKSEKNMEFSVEECLHETRADGRIILKRTLQK